MNEREIRELQERTEVADRVSAVATRAPAMLEALERIADVLAVRPRKQRRVMRVRGMVPCAVPECTVPAGGRVSVYAQVFAPVRVRVVWLPRIADVLLQSFRVGTRPLQVGVELGLPLERMFWCLPVYRDGSSLTMHASVGASLEFHNPSALSRVVRGVVIWGVPTDAVGHGDVLRI